MSYPYEFRAKIDFIDYGRMAYCVVYLPNRLAEELKLKENPKLRIEGEINEVPIQLALQPKKGRWYLMLSKRLMKLMDSDPSESVEVSFRIADQDHVEVPLELQRALEDHAKAGKVWDSLTPGRKRGLSHRVSIAKREETREKRIAEVIQEILGSPARTPKRAKKTKKTKTTKKK